MIAAATASLGATSEAHADAGSSSASTARAAAPLSATLTGDAKSAYDAGKLLLEDHDYSGASAKFRAAYDASHDARLLWNLAVCEKEQRHYARASVLVDRFVKDAVGTVSAEQLTQATATQAALKQFFSMVTLNVQPDGATVLVDGEDVGHAPFAEPIAVDVGKHVVHVQRDGFAPVDRPLDITGQTTAPVTVTLAPAVSVAFLAVNPSDAADAVAIDNRAVGRGAWSGTLPPGPHEVKVSRDGMQPRTLDLSLAANEHRSLDVTLEKEKAALWPWLVGGGAVVVAGAVIGGYFLFKPSDTQEAFPTTQLQNISLKSERIGGRR